MSESSREPGSEPGADLHDDPYQDLGDLDPAQFVGEPPAGDDSPDEFMSRDQQPDRPSGQPTRTEEDA